MIPIPVPDAAKAARSDCHVERLGPPVGVDPRDCGPAEMLVGGAPSIPGAVWTTPNYVYYRPTPAELEQLRAGGFVEFAQYGPTVQPFSAAVWSAGLPNEGDAGDGVTAQGEVGRDAAAPGSHDGADSHDVGPVASEATPADGKAGAASSAPTPAPPAACAAKIRPFPDDTELACERAGGHDEHLATLRDYAWPGSTSELTWQEDDRRTFRGEWHPCHTGGCVLPDGHRGRHAA